MKKSNKKTPKSLPKYYGGGMNWGAAAQTIGQAGSIAAQRRNQFDYEGNEKMQQQASNEALMNNTADTVFSNIPQIGQYYTLAKGASDLGRSFIEKDEYGKAKNNSAQMADNFMNPTHQQITSDLSKGQYGEAALSAVFNKGVASAIGSIAPNTGVGKWMTKFGRGEKVFANGGMNMVPNAEVESQENVVAPNGGFLQVDGPTHENGGVPVNIPQGAKVFSDRLKMPGTKKTFAELNKPNNTNKEDKILSSNKHGNISKHTAELMKLAKNKNSDNIFAAQEALKQAKVEAYAKKLGVTLPQTDNQAPQEFSYGGNFEGDPLKDFVAQRFKSDVIPGKVKNYKPEGNDLNFVDRLNRVPLEGARFQTDSVVAIPGADPNLKAAYKDGKFVIVGSSPKAQKIAAEFNKGNFKQASDKTVFADYSGYLPKKAYGGKMLPKYSVGGKKEPVIPESLRFVPQIAEETEGDNIIVPGYTPPIVDHTSVIEPDKYNTFGKPLDNWSAARLNKTAWDADYRSNPNAEKPNTDTDNPNKINWNKIGSNIAMGLANNAGNIYNLSRYNKPEIERYERLKATLLDPTAAMRDAEAEARRAAFGVRNASGGNAGTYLSNRVALNAQNVVNKDRIRKEYANANAGISNAVAQHNNQLAMQEVIANAENRARTRSGKGEAIGSMGSNIANQMMDNKKGAMDQKTLQLMMKYYEKYPAFAKMIKEQDWA